MKKFTVLHPESQLRFWYESGSVSQRYGSEDPNPRQKGTDPEHWLC
jgi:hypothetical protein